MKDPNSTQWMVSIGNHCVVNKLGGLGQAFKSGKLTGNDIDTIWDDRVLNHACRLSGEIPTLALEAANDALPLQMKKRLAERSTPSVQPSTGPMKPGT